MTNIDSQTELLHAARCEDLKYAQIRELSVLGEFERKTIDVIKGGGAHLLQGARGMGKSMLLRLAEIEMDTDFATSRTLAVYVNFKTSTILEGVRAGERDAFQIWVNVKILQALHDKMTFLNLIGTTGQRDPYYRVFKIDSVEATKDVLEEKLHLLQKLALGGPNREVVLAEIGTDFLDRVLDTGVLRSLIGNVVSQFTLSKIVLLFDEAAHTFIPSQQEIFFEIFKLLHGDHVSVKAAVYPTVTNYGRNFEVGHDAIIIPMDRFEPGKSGRDGNRNLFRGLLTKRLPQSGKLRKHVFTRGEVLDLCIDLSTGNPRAFLHLLNRAIDGGFSERSLLLATQEFVDQELLPYHQNLTKRLPKFAHHVRIGLDLLRGYIVPEIRAKNHRQTKSGYQSAFFTVQRDMSPNLKLALDILCYSGVLLNKGTVKIAERQTGLRYMVNLALLATEKAFESPKLSDAIGLISLTDYREFSISDPQIETFLRALQEASDQCPTCLNSLTANAKFCGECGTKVESKSIVGSLLEESVNALSISEALRKRVLPHFPRVGDVVQARREEIMKIKWIKEVRSRIVKNAADEFISG
jgi:hypothetical protein